MKEKEIYMIFDKNQKEFQSKLHEAIWEAGIHILPLELTLTAEVRSSIPSYLVESCEQMQKFFLHLLNDVYENPEIYMPLPENRLGVQCKIIIPFIDLAITGEAEEDNLTINRVIFDKLVDKLKNNRAYENYRTKGSLEQRTKIFERNGMKYEYNNGNAVMTNSIYPNMFYAMRELAQKTLKEKRSGDNSFTYCDFRKLCKGYKYDKYESALAFLSDEQRKIAEKFDNMAKKYKMVRSINSGHCAGYVVVYTYMKNEIMTINCLNNETIIQISPPFDRNDPDCNDIFYKSIENDSHELKRYFLKHLKRCGICPHVVNKHTPDCARRVRIFDLPQLLHGNAVIESKNTYMDFPLLEKMIDYIILSYKSKH